MFVSITSHTLCKFFKIANRRSGTSTAPIDFKLRTHACSVVVSSPLYFRTDPISGSFQTDAFVRWLALIGK